jgi:hypothetical protein
MKVRTIALTLALCIVGLTAAFAAENPNMGTWKLNEAKSKIPAGMTKNTTVTYTPAGDDTKVTTDGINGAGQPAHTEWTGKFDGKDYPVTGDPTSDSRSYKMVNERTLELTSKKDGKVVSTGKIEVARDGKSRTVKLEGTASGKKVKETAEYDKQ